MINIYRMEITKKDGRIMFTGVHQGEVEDSFSSEFNLDNISVFCITEGDPRVVVICNDKEKLQTYSSGMNLQMKMIQDWDGLFEMPKAELTIKEEVGEPTFDTNPDQPNLSGYEHVGAIPGKGIKNV